MKFFNPTARKAFKKCPKRFSYRYIESSMAKELDGHDRRHQLYGLRELAGHFIHRTLAEMVRAIAEGDHSWDYKTSGRKCVDDLMLVVAKSFATAPGEWVQDCQWQLAETFNGAAPQGLKDDICHWRDSIPTMIENAYGAAHALQLVHETSTHRLEAEKHVSWNRQGHPNHLIMDVVSRTSNARSDDHIVVVDWKSHSIQDEDIHQLRWYLRYFHEVEGIPDWKLHGFVVPLTRGKPEEVNFDPYKHLVVPARPRGFTIPRTAPQGDRYPAKPHPELCVSCPYASMCSDALVSTACAPII
jgi:hypothetical protein